LGREGGRDAGIAGERQKKGPRLQMQLVWFYVILFALAFLQSKVLQF